MSHTPVYLARVQLREFFEYWRMHHPDGGSDEYFWIDSAGAVAHSASAPTHATLDAVDITPLFEIASPTYVINTGTGDVFYWNNTDLVSNAGVPSHTADPVPWVVISTFTDNIFKAYSQAEGIQTTITSGTPPALVLTNLPVVLFELYFSAGSISPLYDGHMFRPALRTILNTSVGFKIEEGKLTGQAVPRIGAMTLDISDKSYDSITSLPWGGRAIDVWRADGEDSIADIDDSLVAAWNLNELSGDYLDSIGNFDMERAGGATTGIGVIGNAVSLGRSSSQFLFVPHDTAFNPGTGFFTVWAWFAPKDVTVNAAVFGKWDEDTTQRAWLLWLNASSDKCTFFISDNGSSGTNIAASTTYQADVWQFVAAWYDGVNIYIQINNGSIASAAWTSGSFATSTADVKIGALNDTPAAFFDGNIDMCGFADKVLSADTLARLYSDGAGFEVTDHTIFHHVLHAVVDHIEWDQDELLINLADPAQKLLRPIQETLYLGTGGVEGGADLLGKPKPLAWGELQNVPPVLVDRASLLYQVHDGRVVSFRAVYDRGVAITFATNLTDVTTWTPVAGQYATSLTTGLFRLGSAPVGPVTADLQGGRDVGSTWVPSYPLVARDMVERLLIEYAGFVAADFDSTQMQEYDTDQSGHVSIYIDAPTPLTDVVSFLAVGGVWGCTFQGLFRMKMFEFLTPVLTITDDHLVESGVMLRLPTPAPPWRLRLGLSRSWLVHSESDIASGAVAARKDFISQELRFVSAENPLLKAKHLLSVDIEQETALTDQAASPPAFVMQDEVERQFKLLAIVRDTYQIEIRRPAVSLQILDTVTFVHERFGLANGKDFLVLEIEESSVWSQGRMDETVVLTLWG